MIKGDTRSLDNGSYGFMGINLSNYQHHVEVSLKYVSLGFRV